MRKGFFSSGLVAVILSLFLLTVVYFIQSDAQLDEGYEADYRLYRNNLYFSQSKIILKNSFADAISDASAAAFREVVNSKSGEPYECALRSLNITDPDRNLQEGCCRNYCIGTSLFSGEYNDSAANDTIKDTCDFLTASGFQIFNQTMGSYISQTKDQLGQAARQDLNLSYDVALPSSCSYSGEDAFFTLSVDTNLTMNSTFWFNNREYEFRRSELFSETYTVNFDSSALYNWPQQEIVDFVNITVSSGSKTLFSQPLNLYVSMSNSDACSASDLYPYDSIVQGTDLCR